MMCCGSPVPVTPGTTQTIANLWVLPPIALQIEPPKILNVLATDAIAAAPAQKEVFVIVMIAGITTKSQALGTAKARIIMPNLETTPGPVLAPDPILVV